VAMGGGTGVEPLMERTVWGRAGGARVGIVHRWHGRSLDIGSGGGDTEGGGGNVCSNFLRSERWHKGHMREKPGLWHESVYSLVKPVCLSVLITFIS
jgi:hypothetical protein